MPEIPSAGFVNSTSGDIRPINAKEAFVWGFFYADGSCGKYGEGAKVEYSWALNKTNTDLLNKARAYLDEIHANDGITFKILETIQSSGTRKLVPTWGAIRPMVERYRPLFYHEKTKEKRVPTSIFNASLEIRKAFFEGYYAGDGDKDEHGYVRMDNKGKIGCAGLALLAESIGYPVSINDRKGKPAVFRLTCTRNDHRQRKQPSCIKKLYEVTEHYQGQYVYDFETENHHFSAGIGRLVVHNTDSVMVEYNVTIERALAIGKQAAELVSKKFKKPIKLEFEKVYFPFLLIAKKRYTALYWTIALFYDKMDMKGLETVRRDSIVILRETMEQALRTLLNRANIDQICKPYEAPYKAFKQAVKRWKDNDDAKRGVP